MWGWSWVENLLQDVRYGLRAQSNNPIQYFYDAWGRVTSVVLCAFLCTAGSPALGAENGCEARASTVVVRYYTGYSVVGPGELSPDLREYFAQKYRGSRPGCVEEDFDGDGTQDYALLLRKKTGRAVVERLVVLRGKSDGSFIPLTLETLKDRLGNFYIRAVAPGRIRKSAVDSGKEETITLKRPALELVL
jgi:hypothetical protein